MTDIIRETYDSTLRMGRSAYQALGADEATATSMIEAFNSYDRDAMIAVASVYKPGVAAHENEELVAKVLELRGMWEEGCGKRMPRPKLQRSVMAVPTQSQTPVKRSDVSEGPARHISPLALLRPDTAAFGEPSVYAHRVHVVLAGNHKGQLPVAHQRDPLPILVADGIK